MITYNIDVYLRHTEMENMYVRELIELVTNDYNGNVFNFTIYDKDQSPYDLTGKAVALIVRSELGTVIQDNCTLVDAIEGTAKITLPSDMFVENGTYYAEVQVWKGNSRLTSLPFDYTVRLSLETDETVKADNRFSLLQQALEDISNADTVSKEALQIANQAKTIVDDLVPKTNDAATKAQEALDRATSVVTQEELANKINLNSTSANLDFIENQVVQEGLIFAIKNNVQIGNIEVKNKGDVFYWYGNANANLNYGYMLKINKFNIGINILQGKAAVVNTSDGKNLGTFSLALPTKKDYLVTLQILANNKWVASANGEILEGINANEREVTNSVFDNYPKILMCYNRQLTAQEVQHSFQVLNNQPSLSHIDVTDANSNKKSILFGTDSYHVIGANGKTDEERYTGLLKTMAKEFTSTDGAEILINNCIEDSKILSGEIKGNTVKNEVTFYTARLMDKINNFTITPIIANTLQVGKQYTIVYFIKDFVGSGNLSLAASATIAGTTVSLANGILKKLYTPTVVTTPEKILVSNRGEDFSVLVYGVMILEGDFTNKDIGYFTGLGSTQAVISNNGSQYPVYEPTIQGKTSVLQSDGSYADTGLVPSIEGLPPLKDGDVLDLATRIITFANKITRQLTIEEVDAYKNFKKVISLDKVGDVASVFEIKYDGSGVFNKNANKSKCKDLQWVLSGTTEGDACLRWECKETTGKAKGNIAEDQLVAIGIQAYINSNWNKDFEKIVVMNNGSIQITLPKTKATTIDEFMNYVEVNNITFGYQLSTSEVGYIPKEAMTTIPINQTNVFSVSDAVKASEFKVTVPINKIKTLEDRLAALEAKTNTKVVNAPYVEETLTISKNKINEVMKNV